MSTWITLNAACLCRDTKIKHNLFYLEGPEGVKWELGFAYFCTGKMEFGSLGLGITNSKLGMGNA